MGEVPLYRDRRGSERGSDRDRGSERERDRGDKDRERGSERGDRDRSNPEREFLVENPLVLHRDDLVDRPCAMGV